MSASFDVIVVGLGAMGSQALHHLARRGLRVLGLDRHRPPHGLGSSGGRTRIIREAYFEDPRYVPLVQRAYTHWSAQERALGRTLLVPTGGVMIGPRDGELVAGALRSAETHRLAHEVLDHARLRERFGAFAPGPEVVGVWEPRAGVLLADAAIEGALTLAGRSGAVTRYEEAVTGWTPDARGVTVHTGTGAYRADRLVVAAGAWLPALVPDLPLPLTVTRQPVLWLASDPERAAPAHLPIWIWEWTRGRFVYGFPDLGEGAKVARHYEGTTAIADAVDRAVSAEEAESLRALVGRLVPGAAGPVRESLVCLYTNTPDLHFVLATLPGQPRVLVASPCSGHGFKFAPVIGELVADLVTRGEADLDVTLFRLAGR